MKLKDLKPILLSLLVIFLYACGGEAHLNVQPPSPKIEEVLRENLLGKNLQTKIPLGKKYVFVDEEGYKFTLKVITEIYPDEYRYFASKGLLLGTRERGRTRSLTPKIISGRPVPPSEVETIPEGTLMFVNDIKSREDGIEMTLTRGDEEAKVRLMTMNNSDFYMTVSMLERAFEIESTGILSSLGIASSLQEEIERMASLLSEKIADSGKKSVAVVDFLDLKGNITELGRFLAEEFSVALAGMSKGFEVVDRTHLKTLLEEHELSTTGLIDPETTKQLGKITGVDALVTGSITPLESSVRISAKILDTSTAKLIGATSGEIVMTRDIAKMAEAVIEEQLSAQSSSTPTGPAPESTTTKVMAQGFIFEVKNCQLIGTSLRCSLTVTNTAEIDRDLRVYWRRDLWGPGVTRFFDETGNEYRTTSLQLGNRMNSRSYSFVGYTMVQGIPTKLIIFFDNIRKKPNKISLLEIYCESRRSRFKVQLRNIPVAR